MLTGLPPSPGAIEAFKNSPAPDAYESIVDSLLNSEGFGERWARHWMDWFRYAESHGSEGDPAIHFAWKYRDYLIRALNDDVPYDQLLREHIAGDLLDQPRIHDGSNESAVGTAHFRMVQHGFAPTDALDERVRFTDNQIDVITKGFLGLTVSCARCHDHKFDAISQKDFYALYGILTSCRPATQSLSSEFSDGEVRQVMRRLKLHIRDRVATAWKSLPIAEKLLNPDDAWKRAFSKADTESSPLHAWKVMQNVPEAGGEWEKNWKQLVASWQSSDQALRRQEQYPYEKRWTLSNLDQASQWFSHGTGMPVPRAHSAGEFHLHEGGEQAISRVFPAGVMSHSLSTADSAVLESPKVLADGKFRMYVRVAGNQSALARYVVHDYPRSGTVYPVSNLNDGVWKWQNWNLDYWAGELVHCEVATAADSPVLGRPGNNRSWVAARELIFVRSGEPEPGNHFAESVGPLFRTSQESDSPSTPKELASLYQVVLHQCLDNWKNDQLTDQEALFLDFFLNSTLLPNTLDELPSAEPLIAEFRQLEKKLNRPNRAPGIVEAEPVTQPLFVRGNHKDPGEPVPRRFLDVFGARNYAHNHSGRLELANDFLGSNPLAARVIVNRLWHHVFGRGIVPTTDNFGRLGKPPSHPELLDYLATKIRDDGWSLKKLIRLMVTSDAFQLSATASTKARDVDPKNSLLSHWTVRRLEAEAIRDSILKVSGRLESDRFGPPVEGNSNRRSIYVRVIRNNLDPFLTVFDAPTPNSTHGARQTSNVPAQALTMINDPNVRKSARSMAESISGPVENRIASMFTIALGRSPSDRELIGAKSYVEDSIEQMRSVLTRRTQLENQQATAQLKLRALVDPIREKLLADKNQEQTEAGSNDLRPLAAWDFSKGIKDLAGEMHLELIGSANVENGALNLDGDSAYAKSAPVPESISSKTLEVWVQLSGLNQKGGGAISLETANGVDFDSIVYAERQGRRWMSGSDNFRRTDDFAGATAENIESKPVHIAIVYDKDGTITGYRNGVPYGKSYRSDGPYQFREGNAHVVLGLRHSSGGPSGRLLKGAISRASLYDRALSAEEILISSRGEGSFVSDGEILEELDDRQRAERSRLLQTIALAESELAELTKEGMTDELLPWTDLAHSLFNLKEFIYLR